MVCCGAAARSAAVADRSSWRARRSTRTGWPARTVAIPGRLTTAALLVRLFAPGLSDANIVVLPFHEIMPAVCSGQVDAGVIIHESRFTYQRHGLTRIVDLGEWWERETGHAIPLGGIAMRRDLGAELIRRTERALTASVDHAHAHPGGRLADHPAPRPGDGRRCDAPAHRVVRERLHARLRRGGRGRHPAPAGNRRAPRALFRIRISRSSRNAL